MSTRTHRITSILAAGALAGAGLVLAPSAAMAAPTDPIASLSQSSLAILAAHGFSVDRTTTSASAGFHVTADDGSGLVYGSATYAADELPTIPSGVDVMNDSKLLGWVQQGTVGITPAVHSSWREGGTENFRSMTWLTDRITTPVPTDLLAQADIYGHTADTYSDATSETLGFYVQDADPVLDAVDSTRVGGMHTVEAAVFVPVSINLTSSEVTPAAPADAVYTVDAAAHSVSWSSATGETVIDGVRYQRVSGYTVTGFSASEAVGSWHAMSTIEDALRAVGAPLDPAEPPVPCSGTGCKIGIEDGGDGNSAAVWSIDTAAFFNFEPIEAPPVTPPVSTPAVSTPETPAVETPAIPVLVESGDYRESMPTSYWLALAGFLAAVGAVVGGLVMRRRRGDAA